MTVFYPVTQVHYIFKKFLQLKLMMLWFLKFIQFLRNCDSLTFIYRSLTKFWSEATIFLICLPSWIFKLQEICFWKKQIFSSWGLLFEIIYFRMLSNVTSHLKKNHFLFSFYLYLEHWLQQKLIIKKPLKVRLSVD